MKIITYCFLFFSPARVSLSQKKKNQLATIPSIFAMASGRDGDQVQKARIRSNRKRLEENENLRDKLLAIYNSTYTFTTAPKDWQAKLQYGMKARAYARETRSKDIAKENEAFAERIRIVQNAPGFLTRAAKLASEENRRRVNDHTKRRLDTQRKIDEANKVIMARIRDACPYYTHKEFKQFAKEAAYKLQANLVRLQPNANWNSIHKTTSIATPPPTTPSSTNKSKRPTHRRPTRPAWDDSTTVSSGRNNRSGDPSSSSRGSRRARAQAPRPRTAIAGGRARSTTTREQQQGERREEHEGDAENTILMHDNGRWVGCGCSHCQHVAFLHYGPPTGLGFASSASLGTTLGTTLGANHSLASTATSFVHPSPPQHPHPAYMHYINTLYAAFAQNSLSPSPPSPHPANTIPQTATTTIPQPCTTTPRTESQPPAAAAPSTAPLTPQPSPHYPPYYPPIPYPVHSPFMPTPPPALPPSSAFTRPPPPTPVEMGSPAI